MAPARPALIGGTSLSAAFAAAACLTLWRIVRDGRGSYDGAADAIAVFGAAVRGDVPSQVLAGRVRGTALLHRRDPALPVVACGTAREVAVMARALAAEGVAPERIVEEPSAVSTRATWEALGARFGAGARIVAVSSGFHLHRVLAEASRQGLRATGWPAPRPRALPALRRDARRYAREMVAVWFYALRPRRRRWS